MDVFQNLSFFFLALWDDESGGPSLFYRHDEAQDVA